MNQLLFAIFFFLPAGLANAAPVFALKLPVLSSFNYPLDFYKKYNGKRVFGNHKTIRGLVAGVAVAIATVLLEQYLYAMYHPAFVPFAYDTLNPIVLGFLFGVGALGADAIKSFFKRQKGITEGVSWIPWDQLDFILGACILSALYVRLNIPQYLTIIILFFVLHLLAKAVGYFLKLNKYPI